MKIDFNQGFKALDGTIFKDGDKDLVLKDVAVSILMQMPDKGLTGSEKIERNKIAEKVYSSVGELELSLSEVGKIKNLLEKENSLSVRIVALALEMLEGKKEKESCQA